MALSVGTATVAAGSPPSLAGSGMAYAIAQGLAAAADANCKALGRGSIYDPGHDPAGPWTGLQGTLASAAIQGVALAQAIVAEITSNAVVTITVPDEAIIAAQSTPIALGVA